MRDSLSELNAAQLKLVTIYVNRTVQQGRKAPAPTVAPPATTAM